MPYSTNDRPRGTNSRGSGQRSGQRPRSGQGGRGRQNGARLSEPQRRESRTPYRSNRNYRTIAGHDTGLNVHNNSPIGFDRAGRSGRSGRPGRGGRGKRRSGLLGRYGIDNRQLALMLGALVILILLIFGISSCVRSCSSGGSQKRAAKTEVNSYDERVAAGVTKSLTNDFTPVLDRNEKIEWIAKHADEYSDERLPELALREDAAVDFVASVPKSKAQASAYTDGTEKGSYPLLYDWDTRWGYVDYAGSVMGVTGSGPTALSMAYMGATGKNDQTPNALAKLATDGKYTDKETGTSAAFFTEVGANIGLDVREYTPSGDNISLVLSYGQAAIVELKANFTTPYAHWAVVVSANKDGSVTLYDPDSTEASTHTWSAGTIGSNSTALYSVAAGTQASTDSSDSGSSKSTSSDTASSSDSGTSANGAASAQDDASASTAK